MSGCKRKRNELIMMGRIISELITLPAAYIECGISLFWRGINLVLRIVHHGKA